MVKLKIVEKIDPSIGSRLSSLDQFNLILKKAQAKVEKNQAAHKEIMQQKQKSKA